MRKGLWAIFCTSCLLLGCATRPVAVVEQKEFLQMARRMPGELQARRLLDANLSYLPAMGFASFNEYGPRLFRNLSPSFIFNDAGRTLPGETFAAGLQPGSRPRIGPNGFMIEQPSQRITVSMVAIADWDGDGTKEWIVSCKVQPKRGGRDRTYYVLIPPPRDAGERLRGAVAAVWECFGHACSLYVRDSKATARLSADPGAGATEVQDVVPGLQPVTTPPEKTRQTDALKERDL